MKLRKLAAALLVAALGMSLSAPALAADAPQEPPQEQGETPVESQEPEPTEPEEPAGFHVAAKAALLSGAARTEGRRSRAWYAARSQLTKRRRTGASPLSFAKWAAFAAKCCLQDIFRKGD